MSAAPDSIPTTVPALTARVDVATFRKAVQLAAKYANGKTLPILGCVVISGGKGGLTLRATNLDEDIVVTVPGWNAKGGPVAVRAGDLRKMLRGVPSGSSTLDVTDATVTLTVDDVVATCTAQATDDFPPAYTIEGKGHTLDPDEFDDLARIATLALSDGSRPVLTAVQLDGTRAAATDSYRLATATVSRRRLADGALVPAAAIRAASQHARGRDVHLTCGETHARLSWTRDDLDVDLAVRLTEGSYPDVRKFVTAPVEGKTVSVPRRRLLDIVRRHAAFLGAEGYQAPMTFTPKKDGTVTIESKPIDRLLTDSVAIRWPGEVALNGELLIGLLQVFTGDEVDVSVGEPLKPVKFTDGDVTAVLMPMRVS